MADRAAVPFRPAGPWWRGKRRLAARQAHATCYSGPNTYILQHTMTDERMTDSEEERTSTREQALDAAPSDVEGLRVLLLQQVASATELADLEPDVLTRGGTAVASLERDLCVAEAAATTGIDRETYLEAHRAAVESLVNEVFQSLLADAVDAETARAELLAGLSVLQTDLYRGTVGLVGGTGPGERHYPGASDILGALPMPAFLLDDEHTVLAYNDAIANLLGIGPDEALGRDNRETIAAASYTDERRSRSLADKVVDAPRTADQEYDVDRVLGQQWADQEYVYEDTSTLLNRRGEEIDIAFTAIPIFDDDGGLRAVLELVEERSSGIEEFPGLAGILSHDIRNPLTILQGSIDAVEDQVEDRQHELMQQSVDRIEELITGVLDLARRASEETDPTRTALDPLAQRAWSAVETRGADLETEPMTIEADRRQLRQALENLFHNAVEHGPPERDMDGEGQTAAALTVRVGPCDGGFYVEDTGTGIPEAERGKVFEHGYSADREGTGFGLPIVHKIAQNHGWSIDLTESAEGGARFEFS